MRKLPYDLCEEMTSEQTTDVLVDTIVAIFAEEQGVDMLGATEILALVKTLADSDACEPFEELINRARRGKLVD